MIKRALLSTAATLVCGQAAFADFSGAYAGLTFGPIIDGEGTYLYSGSPGDSYDLEGNGVGLYGGYNFQNDSMVYGAELAILSMDGQMPSAATGTYLKGMVDLKGRLGYNFGRTLAYGFVGYSSGDWTNSPSNSLTNPNMDGMNYGFGFEYMMDEKISMGVEYIHRDLEAGFNENDNAINADFGMVQFRLGYQF